MVKVIDLRGKTMGGNSKRKISQIRKIARHHSATTDGDVFAFERHWKNVRKWNTGGYHEVILSDGTVQLCYDADVITNGVKGHNTSTYHICLVGNGSFTEEQERAFEERAKYNIKRFGLSVNDVLGHQEFSGQNTVCPGINMNKVRNRLRGSSNSGNSTSSNKSDVKSNLIVDGKWGPATTKALQRALGTPVDGIISRQLRNSVTTSLYGNTVNFGQGGSPMIRALQRKIGAKVDGYLGPETICKLQQYLGTVVDGKLSRPSLVVKEMQRRLNNGTF